MTGCDRIPVKQEGTPEIYQMNEDIAYAIRENITRNRIKQARLFAKAGVDILRLGDDIVSQQPTS